jgi:hypothetical protein
VKLFEAAFFGQFAATSWARGLTPGTVRMAWRADYPRLHRAFMASDLWPIVRIDRRDMMKLKTIALALALAVVAPIPAYASEWRDVDGDNLVVMDMAHGRVLIELSSQFAPKPRGTLQGACPVQIL